jgi:hypothetical protein
MLQLVLMHEACTMQAAASNDPHLTTVADDGPPLLWLYCILSVLIHGVLPNDLSTKACF